MVGDELRKLTVLLLIFLALLSEFVLEQEGWRCRLKEQLGSNRERGQRLGDCVFRLTHVLELAILSCGTTDFVRMIYAFVPSLVHTIHGRIWN
ncbi:unnamed protein product [Citrullus colocynthis]|uniref:Secreted protein n=1 Tax=Citrullus colocynthis TaxID=252529 RepID=A0ABP0XP81_9ROSI